MDFSNTKLVDGVIIDGSVEKDFEVLEVDSLFEQTLTNTAFAQRQPQSWVARLASAILKSVGPVGVRDQYAASGCKTIPDAVRNMSLQDLTYVLLCGHVNTYGTVIEGVEGKCTSCGSVIKADVNLSDIDADPPTDRQAELVVDLPAGYVHTAGPDGKKRQPYHGKRLNRFTFNIPLVRHALQNEKYFDPSNPLEFNLRVAQSAIKSVESTVDVAGDRCSEFTLSDEDLGMLRNSLLINLKGKDRQVLRRAFKNLDWMKLDAVEDCRCGGQVVLSVGVYSLFPLV